MNIAKTSPLYEYWNSDQNEKDERNRLLMINSDELASNLFRYEPYKWEVLYQSSMNDILHGDSDAIPALKILLNTLQDKVIVDFINKIRNHNMLLESYWDEENNDIFLICGN